MEKSLKPALVDPFGRAVTYLRLSVTDRCDFRCTYCMAEDMTFLPKKDVLSLEELQAMAEAFIGLGVRKIRLTGGEPLVRRDIMTLVDKLGRHVKTGALDELTLTTNASQLSRFAGDLKRAGLRRINVSLDTLDADRFRALTRRGNFDKVMAGIEAGLSAGLQMKVNAVALKGINQHEFDDLIRWTGKRYMDLTLIEAMPMGEIDEDRADHYLPLNDVFRDLSGRWTLIPSKHRTGGPARYFDIVETGRRLGLITPLTHNFCEGCNRVRMTCTGMLYMCLGQGDSADLRSALRVGGQAGLETAIREAITRKPKGHDFVIDRPGAAPAVPRHMSMTGG